MACYELKQQHYCCGSLGDAIPLVMPAGVNTIWLPQPESAGLPAACAARGAA